jgi:hypothetical protein
MSEHNLTDEDLEAIDRIVEGGLDRQHGEALLGMLGDSGELRRDADRALLDALSRTQFGDDDAV